MMDFTQYKSEGIAREGNVRFSCPLISEITANFWQGGCIDGVHLGGKFEHVISLYPWERFNPECELKTFVVVQLEDGPIVPNVHQLYAIANLVDACQKLGPTLVHCQAGLNRSGLVAGLALVLNGMQPVSAIALLREKRSPAVLCNRTFEDWLLMRPPGGSK